MCVCRYRYAITHTVLSKQTNDYIQKLIKFSLYLLFESLCGYSFISRTRLRASHFPPAKHFPAHSVPIKQVKCIFKLIMPLLLLNIVILYF